MRKIIIEDNSEGLMALLGEHVMLFCANYIYAGTLVGVNESCVLLDNAMIVYETGAFDDPKYKDAQSLPTKTWYVQTNAIESFGIGKRG